MAHADCVCAWILRRGSQRGVRSWSEQRRTSVYRYEEGRLAYIGRLLCRAGGSVGHKTERYADTSAGGYAHERAARLLSQACLAIAKLPTRGCEPDIRVRVRNKAQKQSTRAERGRELRPCD